MSYILDALKKAERERRTAHVPSLGTLHSIPEERRNVWPWLLGGILAVNVAAVGGFVALREWPAPPPAPIVIAPAPATPIVETPAPVPPIATNPVEPATPAAALTITPPARPATTRDDVAAREPDVLKLEVLVYSANPSDRAAYINGQRYLEGQRVNARFVVERITPDSVVLAGRDTQKILKQQ